MAKSTCKPSACLGKQQEGWCSSWVIPNNTTVSPDVSSLRLRLTNQWSSVASHMKTCEFQVKSHKLRAAHFLQDLVFKVKKKSRWKCPFSKNVVLIYCCRMLDLYDSSWRSWEFLARITPPPPKKNVQNSNIPRKKRWKHLIHIFFSPSDHGISWNPHLLVHLFPILLAQGKPCDGTPHCFLKRQAARHLWIHLNT